MARQGASTPKPSAMYGNRLIVANSVVPMAKPPIASARCTSATGEASRRSFADRQRNRVQRWRAHGKAFRSWGLNDCIASVSSGWETGQTLARALSGQNVLQRSKSPFVPLVTRPFNAFATRRRPGTCAR
jgi:hypothetical protein